MILAEARLTIAKENHKPKLKPKIAPPTITPKARKPPITIMFFKKEKSLLLKKAKADKLKNKTPVINPACLIVSIPFAYIAAI